MAPPLTSLLPSERGHSTTALEGEIIYGIPSQPLTYIPAWLEISNGIRMVHISSTRPAQVLCGQADHEDQLTNGKTRTQSLWALPQPPPTEKSSTVKRGAITHPLTPIPTRPRTSNIHVRGIASSQSALCGSLSRAQTIARENSW
jgi:hypothetical protein